LKIIIKNKIISLLLTYTFVLSASLLANTSNETDNKVAEPLPLEELRSFSEVYYFVKSSYVEEIDDKALINAAIKGMVSSLDSHSSYLEPSAFANLTSDNNGEYAGIGLSFNDHELGIQINHIIKNSPADRQNLKTGMIVSQINGINIKQISSDDAYKLLHGRVNSTIKLSIIALKENVPIVNTLKEYTLTREVIEFPSITSALLPDNTGYLAISQFTKKSPNEFIDAVTEMSVGKSIEKLIIDLRNNPGGVLESAIQISDLFIDSGTLLTSSGRASDANEVFKATSFAPYLNFEVVVMINENSASSSEILAAALQDHKRATVLGDTSYGKGSIQSIYFLSQESGLKITTAKYFSPKGHKIQDVGIKPDVKFKTAGLENNQQSKILDDLELLQAFKLLTLKKGTQSH
jgi:carboxyl-terminal processing protease